MEMIRKRYLYCAVFCIFPIVLSISSEGNKSPRIAVIGGGLGGTVAAYELTLLTAKLGINIDLDLFEPGKIGGRLATTTVNGFEFETGGSIIHPENKYMVYYAEKFNLDTNKFDDGTESDVTGFYNGKEFVYLESPIQVFSLAKMWWRYGWDLISVSRQLVDPFIADFKKIYKLQADHKTFDDLESFLAALSPNFPPLLKSSIKSLLLSNNYNDFFIDELLFIATNVNYNQNTDIHAFVGAVALAGAQNGLWSIRGGNKRVPEALLANSDANLIKEKVHSVFLMPNSKYALTVGDKTYVYDYVIIACPIMQNNLEKIKFKGFPQPIEVPVRYKKTVATLVHGELNYKYFDLESHKYLPNHIFSVNNSLFFNCINVIKPVIPDQSYDQKVFKIFSKSILTDDQLDSLFLKRDNTTVVDWLAYPEYNTVEKNLTFILHDNMYYINTIEWAASAMEMSALSGVNAALHVLQRIQMHNIP